MTKTLKYFSDFSTIDAIKKQYKKLAFQFHPDIAGGSTQKMQELNNEYEEALKLCGTANKKNYSLDQEYIDIIDALIKLNMQGVKIEICGWFIWVSGETGEETKQYSKQLGKNGLGLIWHGQKKSWYYKPKWYYNKSKNSWEMDKIRDVYGSEKVNANTNNSNKQDNRKYIPQTA